MRRAATIAMLMGLFVACGGGSGGGAKSADDADEAGEDGMPASGGGVQLSEGTPVCISGIAGVRYQLEDALTERGLTVADVCLGADVELEESGSEGAWVLKHRPVGGEWESCESKEQERDAFLGECLGAMGATLAGGE